MVIVPEELEVVDTTFLFITGSDNTMEWNEDETSDKIKMASHIAVNNRMVAASLFQVHSVTRPKIRIIPIPKLFVLRPKFFRPFLRLFSLLTVFWRLNALT